MLKLLTYVFLIILSCNGNVIIISPENHNPESDNIQPGDEDKEIVDEKISILHAHVLDFLKLIDYEKVLNTAARFIDDPEVLAFVGVFFSPKLKEIVWKFQNLEEFKEAYDFLETEGYDIESLINAVNSGLDLPPKSLVHRNMQELVVKSSQGVNGFIAAMIGSLPLEEMKKLLENKIQNSSEVAKLFDVLKSSEFRDIIRRMFENPKLKDIKAMFEGYGVDFSFMCLIAQEIFGEEYQGILCNKNNPSAVELVVA